MRLNKNSLAAGAASVLVVAGLALGYRTLGPVQDQRAISADERRVSDLRAISIRLASNVSGLPADLAELDNDDSELVRDPVTKARYAYIRGSGTKYQLCATFAFASKDEDPQSEPVLSFWNHSKGRYCYQLEGRQVH